MRILFVVCGEGLGHASRSTKMAKYLESRGHQCLFASYDKGYDFIKNQMPSSPLFMTKREVSLEGDGGYFNLRKTASSILQIPVSVVKSFFQIRKIIKEESVDLVIADTMFAAGVSARTCHVPVLFMTNQNHFGSLADPEGIFWRLSSFIISFYHYHIPQAILIPDFAPPHTISEYNFVIKKKYEHKFRYIGPILDTAMDSYTPTEEIIYASFGGEPFKLPMYSMLKEIANATPDIAINIFSTSENLPEESENYHVFKFVPCVFPYLAKAKVAIIHGGLTSLHESLYYGKPIILIIDPYHPEQGNNGRKVEDAGLGIMLRGDQISKETLLDAIHRAAAMKKYDREALFAVGNGAENAEKIIEEFGKPN